MYVIKIRSVFRCHNMHQYQLHGSHTERQARILTGNRKNREIYLEKYKNTEIRKYKNTEIFKISIPALHREAYIMSRIIRRNIIRRNEEADEENQFKESFSVISILFEKLLQSLSRKFVLFRCSLTRSYPQRTQVPWAQFSHIESVSFIGIATKRQRRRRTPGAAKISLSQPGHLTRSPNSPIH